MAERPVFIPSTEGFRLVSEVFLPMRWHSGFAVSQKQRNIEELHSAANVAGIGSLLEISTKSQRTVGRHLSAFHLKVETNNCGAVHLESAFQASKVFEHGGPFLDLLSKPAKDAKRDPRLQNSGQLIGFQFEGQEFPLEPKSLFYDWLYLNSIAEHRIWLSDRLSVFAGFTDIEFNPHKSISCQARSVALFLALSSRNLLDESLGSAERFRQILIHFHYNPELRKHSSLQDGNGNTTEAIQVSQIGPSKIEQEEMISCGAHETVLELEATPKSERKEPKKLRSIRSTSSGPLQDNTRARWILLLEGALNSAGNQADDCWRNIMTGLKLPWDHLVAVESAIKQGRWREAKDPRAYIKTVAKREALKLELPMSDQPLLGLFDENAVGLLPTFEEALAAVSLRQSSVASRQGDGVWRRGSGISDEADDYDDEGRVTRDISYRDRLISYLPESLKELVPPSPEYKAAVEEWNRLTPDHHYDARSAIAVDWERWAISAGFDKWEHIVLLYTLQGTSREKALVRQANRDNRLALQAAWKRFDRSGRKRLQNSANNLLKSVPDSRLPDTR